MRKNPETTSAGLALARLALLACALVSLASGEERSATQADRLRCGGHENPLGIDATKPRLSWKLDDTRRGARQTAYRVICASSPDALAQGRGDVWDSGKVESEQSHLVPYARTAPASGQIVHWKVKVWDTESAMILSRP